MTTVWTLPSSSARPKAETGHYILTRRKKRRRHRLYRNRPARPPTRRAPSPEAAASPATKEEGRRRRGKGQDYERLFIRNAPSNTRSGKTVYIRKEFHERITRIVQVIGKNELSLYSYLDNVLEQHFATYQEEISELYKKRNSDIF